MEYLLVLIAALFHAIWNSLMKGSSDKLLTLTAIRSVGIVYGLVVIVSQPMIELQAVPYLLVAVLILYLYFYCLVNAYKFGDFSQVYPISRGLSPVVVLVVGWLFFAEQLQNLQLLATLLISAGVLSLALSNKRFDPKPLYFAVATAFCIAGYTVASGLGVRLSGSFWVFSGWLELLTGLSVLSFSLLRRKATILQFTRQHWRSSLLAGVLSVAAFAIALWAMSRIAMAPVAAIRETSVIFAVIIGAWGLKEGFVFKRILASVLVAAGIAILGFSV
ncbi:MAG: DMT family transporter [Pseudomonadales bacterium]|nr:DMT family transporter [Pseudomonadales bacterium]